MPAHHAQAVNVEGIHVDEGKGFRVCGTFICFFICDIQISLVDKIFLSASEIFCVC